MKTLQAMVLAAGYGTRLRPLTDERAKPAVPLLGRPLLDYPLSRLAALPVTRVVVNTHHLPRTVADALQPPPFALPLETIFEPEILGTGGGLKNAAARFADAENVILLNGDTVNEADLAAALDRHRATGALATLVLREDERIARYGAVETDEQDAVLRIAEAGAAGARRGLFTGAHLLSREIFGCLPPAKVFCIVRQVYRPLLARSPGAVRAFYTTARFFDLGTAEDLLDASRTLLREPGASAFALHGLTERAPGIRLHPTAIVPDSATLTAPLLVGPAVRLGEGVRIGPGVVLGAGATVRPGVTLEDCLVWENVTVKETQRRAVLTPLRVWPIPARAGGEGRSAIAD